MKRTILKLEIILQEDDCCPGEHAPFPRSPSYVMSYDEADLPLVENHLNRLAHGLQQWGEIGCVERVR